MASDSQSGVPTRQERIVQFMVRAQEYLAAYGMGDGHHREHLAMLANQMGLSPAEFDQAAALLMAPLASGGKEEELVPAEPVYEVPSPQQRIAHLVPGADLSSFVRQARLVLAHRRQWDQTLMVTLHSLADDHLIPHEVRPDLFQLLRDPSYVVEPPAARSVPRPSSPSDAMEGSPIVAEMVEEVDSPQKSKKKKSRSRRIPRWADDPYEQPATPVAPSPPPLPPSANVAPIKDTKSGPPPVPTPDSPPATSSQADSAELPKKKRRRSPQEVYRQYLAIALGEITSGRINRRRERRLIAEGTDKLELAPILAQQMLTEAAQEAGLTLVSQQDQGTPDPQYQQRITEFQQRSAEIIARQGGVTSIGRTMIAEVAAELGLDQAQRDEALALIQRQAEENRGEIQQLQRIESFRSFVQEKLDSVEHGIVRAKLASQVVRMGKDLHGLEEEPAQKVLREVIAEEGLMLVSEDQARQHLADHADDILLEEGFLSTEARKRLMAEGRQWGLPSAAIQQLLEDRTQQYEQSRKSSRRKTNLVVAALFSVVVGIVGYFAYHELIDPPSEVRDLVAVAEPDQPEEDPGQWQRQPWWGENLTLDLVDLRQQDPRLVPALDKIGSENPETRARGYRELVPQLVKAIGNSGSNHSKLVRRRAMQGLYQREPDETAAAALAEAMIDPLPGDRDKPTSPGQFRDQFERVLLATWLMTSDDMDSARLALVENPLQRKLGVMFSATRDKGVAAVSEFARIQYRHLRELAARDGDEAAKLHLALTDAAREYVPDEVLIPLDANLVAEVLPRLKRDFNYYRPLVERTINTDQPGYLLPLVDMYQRGGGTSEAIRKELAVLFSVKTGISIDGMSPEEGGRAIRQSLGLHTAASDEDHRKRTYLAKVGEIDLNPSKGQRGQAALQEAVDLAHLATLGQAAAIGEVGDRAFRQLADDQPPRLEESSSRPEPRQSRGAAEQGGGPVRSLDGPTREAIRLLPRVDNPQIRSSNFAALASRIRDVPDVDYSSAQQLVEYLVMPKNRDEQTALIVNLSSFAHWPTLKLALADRVETARRSRDDLLELVTGLVGGPVEVSQRGAWRVELRSILLARALEQFPEEGAATGPVLSPLLLENAADRLADLYRQRGGLEGLSTESLAAAKQPAEVLGRLVDQEMNRLRSAQLSPPLDQQLQHAMHLRRALTALADNEIAETVALQRVWLRLLAIRIESKQPDKQSELQQLLVDLESEDQTAGDVFAQLRGGEAALVKLWQIKVKS